MAKTAYLDLIKYALNKGKILFVDDGEETYRVNGYNEAKAGVESVGNASLIICENREGREKPVKIGWAFIIVGGVGPEESVADFSDNEFMNTWFDKFYEETS